jgi:hypothetical protein
MTILLANLGIGFLNDLFLGLSHSAGPEELSIPFLVEVMKKPDIVPGGWGGKRS